MNDDCHNCGRVVSDDLPLCELCTDVLRSKLRTVPGLVSDMTITRARLDRMRQNLAGGKGAETPLPIRLDKYDRRPTQYPLDLLESEITTWARAVAGSIGMRYEFGQLLDSDDLRQRTHDYRAGRRRDPTSLSQDTALVVEMAAIWLADDVKGLRRYPAIAEMHDAITDAVAFALQAVDRLPDHQYKGTCTRRTLSTDNAIEDCGADLYAEHGAEYVSCPKCWTHYRVRDLERTMMSRIDDQLFTIAEVGRILKELGEAVPTSTLYVWHNRDVIQPVAWRTKDGTITDEWIYRTDPPLFRLRDIRDARAKSQATPPTT